MNRFGYKERHVIHAALAIFIAVLVNFYFSFSGEHWIVIVALLLSQTTRGTPLRQSLIFLMVIVVALLLGTLLLSFVKQSEFVWFIVASVFILIGCIYYLSEPVSPIIFYSLIYFLFILLITLFTPLSTTTFSNRLLDVGLGAAIGIIITQLVFPTRLEKEFRQGLISVLKVIVDYSQTLTATFEQHKYLENLTKKTMVLEKVLVNQYPEWVYETGFNPGLRSGWRYFLIHLEQLLETLFAMSYFVTLSLKPDLVSEIAGKIKNVMEKNQELVEILLLYFEKNEVKIPSSDFTSDVTELENALRALVPSSIELLDMSDEYVTLTAFVRDCKDMRLLLIQLVMTLQTKNHQINQTHSSATNHP